MIKNIKCLYLPDSGVWCSLESYIHHTLSVQHSPGCNEIICFKQYTTVSSRLCGNILLSPYLNTLIIAIYSPV